MTDTAQPTPAAETEVASDPMEDAANAFRNYDPAVPTTDERPRGPDGKFISSQPESEEIEAEGQPEAESQEEPETAEGQPEEAQPEVDLPTSWPAELAEEWQTLPAPVREKIVAREAEREAAVNAKFQEAANVRKANEAVITEANQSRQRFAEAADYVLNMVQPQEPPLSMLQPGSHDYNPDHYHLMKAQADQSRQLLSYVQQQREEALAQLTKEHESKAFEALQPLEAKARPALLKDVPELQDPQKAQPALQEIVRYAVEKGIPQEVFTDPEQAKWVTSAQLHMAWEAMQYRKMKAAQGKVAPKAAKPAAPVVRPGVATSQSGQKAIQRKNVMERLNKEGSIAAGAAAFKLFM